MRGPQPEARRVRQPQPAPLRVPPWDFQSFAPPEPRHAFMVHPPAFAPQQGRAPVGGLDVVRDDMRQRGLDDPTRVVRLLGGPIQSRYEDRKPCGPAAMSWYRSIFRSVDVAVGLALRIGHASRVPLESAGAASRTSSGLRQSGTRLLVFHLHPRRRDCPQRASRVDLIPRRKPDLTGPRRREYQELEGQPDGGVRRARRPHRLDGCGHVVEGQRLPVGSRYRSADRAATVPGREDCRRSMASAHCSAEGMRWSSARHSAIGLRRWC